MTKNLKSIDKKFEITDGTNLNQVFDTITQSKKIVINKLLKGYELIANIFQLLLSSVQPIDFNLFIIEGDISDIKKRLKEVLAPDQAYTLSKEYKGKDMHEDDKIVIIAHYLKLISEENNFGFRFSNNKYYVFNGCFWQNIQEQELSIFLGEMAAKVGLPKLQTETPRIREKLIRQFCTTNPQIKSNKNKNVKINLLNGTYHFFENIECNQKGLKPFNKDDFFKYQLPFNYDPNAKAPLFKKSLDQVLPDIDCQKVFLEFLGYSLARDLKLEKTMILVGGGSNGKSVVFDIVTALFGQDNISNYSLAELTESEYNRTELDDVILNFASEIGVLKDIDTFKRLASGEPIVARLPYGKPIRMTNYCRFMFNANTLPTVEHTVAFFRRQLIIPFDVTISEEQQDVNLAKKIISKELSGIFNLVVESLDRLLQQQRFTKSAVIEAQIEKYRKEGNYVDMFLEEEGWIKSKTQKIRLIDLLEQYSSYCSKNNTRPLQRRNFSARLRNLGFEVLQENQNYFYVYCEKITDKTSITPDLQTSINQLFFKQKDNE